MDNRTMFSMVRPVFSIAAERTALDGEVDKLSAADLTEAMQYIKWLQKNKASDPQLGYLLAKFELS